jgi:hypothetical protein
MEIAAAIAATHLPPSYFRNASQIDSSADLLKPCDFITLQESQTSPRSTL